MLLQLNSTGLRQHFDPESEILFQKHSVMTKGRLIWGRRGMISILPGQFTDNPPGRCCDILLEGNWSTDHLSEDLTTALQFLRIQYTGSSQQLTASVFRKRKVVLGIVSKWPFAQL